MQEAWAQSLGQEDTLEEKMATHFSFLAWIIPWTEELGGLQSMGLQRIGHDWATKHSAAQQALQYTSKYLYVSFFCLPGKRIGKMSSFFKF